MDVWPSFRKTLSFGGLLVGAVLHVALRTVELVTYQFDPHRDYDQEPK